MGMMLLRKYEALAMGGRLKGLSTNARLCAFIMAVHAHDTGTHDAPPRTYFKGWEYLAIVALNRQVYDRPAHLAVARAIRELTDAGLIINTGRRNGVRQGRAMYQLSDLW